MKMGLIVYQSENLEKVVAEFETLKRKAVEGFGSNEILESENSFEIVKSDIKIMFKIDKLYGDVFAIFQIIK